MRSVEALDSPDILLSATLYLQDVAFNATDYAADGCTIQISCGELKAVTQHIEKVTFIAPKKLGEYEIRMGDVIKRIKVVELEKEI